MKRTILLAIAALPLLSAASVFGCLNDRETVAGEQEFRSRYESPSNPGTGTPQPSTDTELPSRTVFNGAGILAAFVGAALIAGGLKIARLRLGPPRSAK